MAELATAALGCGLVAPFLFPLERVAPARAGGVWLAALTLRAVVAVCAALLMLVWLPGTAGFDWLASATWHELVSAGPHVDVSADPLAHALVVAPAGALALWVLAFVVIVPLAALRLNRALIRRAVGRGPLGSLVVADREVFVAVTALGRRRLFVSQAALATMDDEELAASLAHELGHVRRAHRPILFAAALLAAVARLVPGTRATERGLRLSLERDADEYATETGGQPLALASAICKAAAANSAPRLAGAFSLGGDRRTSLRLEQLLGDAPARSGAGLEVATVMLAIALAGLALVAAAAMAASLAPGDWAAAVAIACSA